MHCWNSIRASKQAGSQPNGVDMLKGLVCIKHRMKEELGVEAEMNEEELARLKTRAQEIFDEHEEKHMAQWAECQTANMRFSSKCRELDELGRKFDDQVQV